MNDFAMWFGFVLGVLIGGFLGLLITFEVFKSDLRNDGKLMFSGEIYFCQQAKGGY